MLTGSLYVADSLQSGVAISGYKNTGFIRSLGYEGFDAGFPGFLMWSGSALFGSSGTKGGVAYSGVGLELYANTDNYLRYSTTDSELDIRTDNIFIGNNTTFISASNGNIKISGSNIDLNTEKFFLGNSTNFISGSNGNILISGSNVSVSTKKFFFGDRTTQYISGSNGLLEISSSNFYLKTNGQITASGIDIAGVSQANIIRNKTIVVTPFNSSSYIIFNAATGTYDPLTGTNTYKPAYYTLVLDGSLGGQVVQRVRLNFDSIIQTLTYMTSYGTSPTFIPTYSTINYPVAIASIKLPNISAVENATCIIEISQARTLYINNTVGALGSWSNSFPYWGGSFSGDFPSVPPWEGLPGAGVQYE